ncbi:MAG TPA: polysaccharide biosynthesis/export family protein [Candidatus Thermoplasmatota archaeon]
MVRAALFLAIVLFPAGTLARAAALAPAPAPPPATTPQAPSPAVPAASGAAGAPPEPPARPAEYVVGAGDVLEIRVFGNEDLSGTPTIQPSGVIALPLLGEVPVAGLSLAEVQRKLTTLLARDFLVNPQVEVKVKEYQSQSVSVIGEVNNPGRKPLRGRTRLIDVLLESGGFKPTSSGEVIITRMEGTFDGGARTLRLRFAGGAPSSQDQINLELPLVNGDIITASAKYYVTVEGEVARPGRYPIEGELTVTGAVSGAGGLTRFGSNDIKVRRIDPETKQTKILEVDLKEVRSGKKPDLALLGGDVVTVSRRLF